jgi:hypothetical protein
MPAVCLRRLAGALFALLVPAFAAQPCFGAVIAAPAHWLQTQGQVSTRSAEGSDEKAQPETAVAGPRADIHLQSVGGTASAVINATAQFGKITGGVVTALGNPPSETSTSVRLGYFDDVTVVGPVPGDPVRVWLTMSFTGYVAPSTPQGGLMSLNSQFTVTGPDGQPAVDQTLGMTDSASGSIGRTINSVLSLKAGDVFRVSNLVEADGDGSQSIGIQSSTLYMDMITPGVTLRADSGHDYSSPVAEPASVAPLAAIAALLRRPRR